MRQVIAGICKLTHLVLYPLALIWMTFSIGCVSANVPKLYCDVIEKQYNAQPRSVWQYPALSAMREAREFESLSGLVEPQPVPRFMKDVEPPFVVALRLLSDGSLVCVSPLGLQFELKKVFIAEFWREMITQVRVILLNGENGSVKWSQLVNASGLYDITEINSTLLLHSRKFDKDGKIVEAKLVAMKKKSGDIIWQRSFKQDFNYFNISYNHNIIVFATETTKDSGRGRLVEAIDVSTGKPRWTLQVKISANEENDKVFWPIVLSDRIILFEDGVSCQKLADGKTLWHRKIGIEGIAQPEFALGKIYLRSENGLVALDVKSGSTLWTCATIKESMTKLGFTEKHLCIIYSRKGLFSEHYTLALLDPVTGKVLWTHETKPALGNVLESKNAVFFSTEDRLIALNVKDGTNLFVKKLPWDDEFSRHVVSLSEGYVRVKNEWNVAMWSQKDGRLIYHHRFEPLCPIVTTQERMLEQKELGAQVTPMTTGALMNSSVTTTAFFESSFQHSMSMYRSTGDRLYLSMAQSEYSMAQSSIATERMMTSAMATADMTVSMFGLMASITKWLITKSHSMVYPAVDQVIRSFCSFDDGEYAVRLVGVQVGNQRFSAIELLHEPTGKVKQLLLSPYQMPSGLKTLGSSSHADQFTGYLRAAVYLHNTFSTVVDLKRKRVFHYGPGLNADKYVYFGGDGFARGCLRMLPLELPID